MDDNLLLEDGGTEGPAGEDEEIHAIVEAMLGTRMVEGSRAEDGMGASGGLSLAGSSGKAEGQRHRPQHHQHQALMPSFATSSTPLLGTNTLNEIDQAAQASCC